MSMHDIRPSSPSDDATLGVPAGLDDLEPAPKAPKLPADLKGVAKSRFTNMTLAQLQELCSQRSLCVPSDAGPDALAQALIAHRDKSGRLRRESVSSTGTKRSRTHSRTHSHNHSPTHSPSHSRSRSRSRSPSPPPPSPPSSRVRTPKGKKEKKKKEKKKKARNPSPSSSSSSSRASTPWSARKRKSDLAALEAAQLARLRLDVDRDDRKRHEKKHQKKRHRE